MSAAKKCDRCGNFYTQDDFLNDKEENWRYAVVYDPHPYASVTKDLCPRCLKDLKKWLKGA